MNSVLIQAENTRTNTIKETTEDHRISYSQYLTPPQTASLAVSLFSDYTSPKCLDLGAGTGILSIALYERFGPSISIDVIDIDSRMLSICDDELTSANIDHMTIMDDVITTNALQMYDRIILNPPYKKMASNDSRQNLLPIHSPNLYAAFLMVAVQHLKKGGECVAIIPRSWMNGQYFKQFRKWLLSNASLDAMHIYGSRTDIFSDTNVLQETMIVKLSKTVQSNTVIVSESEKKHHTPIIKEYPFGELVSEQDYVVRTEPVVNFTQKMTPLRDLGFCASTGKVVDFRASEYIRSYQSSSAVKLIYPQNFSKGKFVHPINFKKSQWFEATDKKSFAQLIGPGCTVIVKRFSSKEEKRRIVASFLNMDEPFALENHLNYIHCGTPRKTVLLDATIAKGLTVWLNSTWIDNWFRAISGSTQVNASDLNKMPLPPIGDLKKLGLAWTCNMTTKTVDDICERILGYDK